MAWRSTLWYLTKGSAWADMEDHIGGMGVGDVKGQLLLAVAEAGMEDTSSNSYRWSKEEGGGKEGVQIQLGWQWWHLTAAVQSEGSCDKWWWYKHGVWKWDKCFALGMVTQSKALAYKRRQGLDWEGHYLRDEIEHKAQLLQVQALYTRATYYLVSNYKAISYQACVEHQSGHQSAYESSVISQKGRTMSARRSNWE